VGDIQVGLQWAQAEGGHQVVAGVFEVALLVPHLTGQEVAELAQEVVALVHCTGHVNCMNFVENKGGLGVVENWAGLEWNKNKQFLQEQKKEAEGWAP
jgi:hypothetical protein